MAEKHKITSCRYADDTTLTSADASSATATFHQVVKFEQCLRAPNKHDKKQRYLINNGIFGIFNSYPES